jgi:hypothetical protein
MLICLLIYLLQILSNTVQHFTLSKSFISTAACTCCQVPFESELWLRDHLPKKHHLFVCLFVCLFGIETLRGNEADWLTASVSSQAELFA